MNWQNIFLSLSDFFHLAKWPQVPLMLSQMAKFHYFFNGWGVSHCIPIHNFFIHSCNDRHRGCFFLGLLKPYWNEHRGAYILISAFLGQKQSDAGLYGSIFIFWEKSTLVSTPIYKSFNSEWRLPFCCSLARFGI